MFPLKSATSKAVKEDVFMIYGVPEQIICDNGRQYISNDFCKMISSYDCKISFNAYYHPQANPTERINRVIKTMIRSYVNKDHRTWDENLYKFGFALRTAVHEVTGFTPTFLNFGREIYLSGKASNKFESATVATELDFENREHWSFHMSGLKDLCNKVKSRLDTAYAKSANQYNLRRRSPATLAIGQVVWKRNPTLSDAGNYYASKLAPKFIKCVISEKITKYI